MNRQRQVLDNQVLVHAGNLTSLPSISGVDLANNPKSKIANLKSKII
jgi:hypothetical protein